MPLELFNCIFQYITDFNILNQAYNCRLIKSFNGYCVNVKDERSQYDTRDKLFDLSILQDCIGLSFIDTIFRSINFSTKLQYLFLNNCYIEINILRACYQLKELRFEGCDFNDTVDDSPDLLYNHDLQILEQLNLSIVLIKGADFSRKLDPFFTKVKDLTLIDCDINEGYFKYFKSLVKFDYDSLDTSNHFNIMTKKTITELSILIRRSEDLINFKTEYPKLETLNLEILDNINIELPESLRRLATNNHKCKLLFITSPLKSEMLTISNITSRMLSYITVLYNLTILDLKTKLYTDRLKQNVIVVDNNIINKLVKLKVLKLSGLFLDPNALFNHMPDLNVVHLHGSSILDKHLLSITCIKELNLKDCSNLTHKCGSVLRQVVKLELANTPLDEKALRNLWQVRFLVLCNMRKLAKSIKYFKSVCHLTFYNCPFITHNMLSTISNVCKDLREINITKCAKIDLKSIGNIFTDSVKVNPYCRTIRQ